MKRIMQIVVAVVVLCGLILVSADAAFAAASNSAGANGALQNSELPPDLFDENCDGGPSCPGKRFVDIPKVSHWAHVPIDWAVTHHLSSGTTSTTFSPNKGCTRAAVVTFVWRALGSPKPVSKQCPFLDVSKNTYYYQPVLWAVENGIIAGTSSTTFSPKKVCTRAEIITILWRAMGSPPASGSSAFPFRDVPTDAYYREAVAWAVENGLTSGTTPTTFSPKKTCTRASAMTFLYRAVHR